MAAKVAAKSGGQKWRPKWRPKVVQPLQICIRLTIRIGRESWCLPYAGFFFDKLIKLVNCRSVIIIIILENQKNSTSSKQWKLELKSEFCLPKYIPNPTENLNGRIGSKIMSM